jgi:hypothetical protein
MSTSAADAAAATAAANEKAAAIAANTPLKTGTESSLSNWVGPYVTDMLGQGQALANTGYEAYGGPLTASTSDLQTTGFEGLAGLAVPTDSMGVFTPKSFTDTGVADKYMNPYLQNALNPQIDEARRQQEIQRIADAGRLTKAGAYGGSRQAVLEGMGNRGLLDRVAGITGTGYANAYDKAVGQFNTEQGVGQTAQTAANEYGLGTLLNQLTAGATQRGIESEGITADKEQFEEERDYPYKMVQYLQSLLQGMPLAAQNATFAEDSGFTQALNSAGGAQELYEKLKGFFSDDTPTGGTGEQVTGTDYTDEGLDYTTPYTKEDDLDLIGSGE